jgi:hypothetical protein
MNVPRTLLPQLFCEQLFSSALLVTHIHRRVGWHLDCARREICVIGNQYVENLHAMDAPGHRLAKHRVWSPQTDFVF